MLEEDEKQPFSLVDGKTAAAALIAANSKSKGMVLGFKFPPQYSLNCEKKSSYMVYRLFERVAYTQGKTL